MVSTTKQTMTIRARHIKTAGKRRKALARRNGTPPFPIHPEGYDPDAPDARGTPATSGDDKPAAKAAKKD